jgi:hypothetical protein
VASKLILALFGLVSAAALLLGVVLRDGEIPGNGAVVSHLSDSQIRSMYPCSYYPGQSSGPGMIELLSKASDSVALGRVDRFDFNGFDSTEIEWEAVIRVTRHLKGQGELVYRLPIRSPERNFGPKAEGRLFLIFFKERDGEMLWALEPWLPEYEDIASGG